MSKGAKIAIALGIGLLAALFGILYLNGQRDALVGSSEIVQVYFAAKDIEAHVPLEPEMLEKRPVPRNYLQPGSIPVTEVSDPVKVTGVTLVPIKTGEQIVRTKLYEGAPPPLSLDMKARVGMVAVGVDMIAPTTALAGLVQPGDRVDVLASFEFEKAANDRFTEVRPLFLNVEVMGVNQRTVSNQEVIGAEQRKTAQSEAGSAKTVTLSLPPAAAQQIILAQQLGSIWLLVRGKGDATKHNYEIWNNERLLQSPYRLWKAADSRADLMRQLAGGRAPQR